MNHQVKDELWECPECGARVAIGRYERLAKWGRDDCRSDLVQIEPEQAERLLKLARTGAALASTEGAEG